MSGAVEVRTAVPMHIGRPFLWTAGQRCWHSSPGDLAGPGRPPVDSIGQGTQVGC
jgi:hypothetical protein